MSDGFGAFLFGVDGANRRALEELFRRISAIDVNPVVVTPPPTGGGELAFSGDSYAWIDGGSSLDEGLAIIDGGSSLP